MAQSTEHSEDIEVTKEMIADVLVASLGQRDRVPITIRPTKEGDEGWARVVMRKASPALDDSVRASNLEEKRDGVVQHPIDYAQLIRLRDANIHHAVCIEALVTATCAYGFESEEVYKKLDPLCERSFYETLCDVVNDLADTGCGYLEVKRNGAGKIVGLHHLSPCNTFIELETENRPYYHYRVTPTGVPQALVPGSANQDDRIWAKFGQRARLFEYLKATDNLPKFGATVEDISEVIQFRLPNNVSKWYGIPKWTAALPSIDLIQLIDQFVYDFFQNSGSISQLLAFTGATVKEETWNQIAGHFTQTVMSDGGSKGLAVNIPREISIEKFDLAADVFSGPMMDYDRNKIVDILSAHMTPPTIVGVSPSGKIVFNKSGETRETLQLYQAVRVKPFQQIISCTLERTLGVQEIQIPKAKTVSQEISGVAQAMVEEEVSGWTLKTVLDEIEFEMTPQLGGPADTRNSGGSGEKKSGSASESAA